MTLREDERFAVGDAVVDPALNEIRVADRTVHIEPRQMAVLRVLVARAGETVSRHDLIAAVWGEAAADESLTEAVSRLRRAFGDRASAPRVIQTVPKKGYRLIAPVRAWAAPRPPLRLVIELPRPPRVAVRASAAAASLAAAVALTAASSDFFGPDDPNPNSNYNISYNVTNDGRIERDPDPNYLENWNPAWLDIDPDF